MVTDRDLSVFTDDHDGDDLLVEDTAVTLDRSGALDSLASSDVLDADQHAHLEGLARDIAGDLSDQILSTGETSDYPAALALLGEMHADALQLGRDHAGGIADDHSRAAWGALLKDLAIFQEPYDDPAISGISDRLAERGTPFERDVSDVVSALGKIAAVRPLHDLLDPERTVLVERRAGDLEAVRDAAPFLRRAGYRTVEGYPEDYELPGRHLVGDVPLHLASGSASVTSRERHPDAQRLTAAERDGDLPAFDGALVTYEVRAFEADPSQIGLDSPVTFVSRDPDLVTHWRETGLIAADRDVLMVLDGEALSADPPPNVRFASRSEDWDDMSGPDTLIVYGRLADHEVAELADGHDVVGIPDDRYVTTASSLTGHRVLEGGAYELTTWETRVLTRTPMIGPA